MQALELQLEQAARRMRSVLFMRYSAQHLCIALILTSIVALIDKSGLLILSEWPQTGIWQNGMWAFPSLELPLLYQFLLATLLLASIGLSALRVLAENMTSARIALAIDERLGLKERLTSASELEGSDLPMVSPLIEDARQHCQNMNLREVFPMALGRAGRRLPWYAIGAAAMLLILPDMDLLGVRAARREAKAEAEADREKVDQMAKHLKEQSEVLRKDLKKREFKKEQLEELTRKMKELAEKMEKDRQIDSKKAKEMINRLQEEMKENIAEEQQRQREMDKLSGLSLRDRRSLMRKTIEEMKDNDFAGAADEFKRMRRELLRKKMDPEELKRLQKDMNDLSDQLKKMGLQKLQKQFEDMANDLKDLQNTKDLEKLDKMREALADTLKNLQSGKQLDLSKLTDEEKELLKKLQKMVSKMEMTEETLRQMQKAAEAGQVRQITQEDLKKMLQQMKDGNMCPGCGRPGNNGQKQGQGQGQKQGQGQNQGQGQKGEGQKGEGQKGQGQKEQGKGEGQDGNGEGEGEGVCPVCGRKHGGKGGGGLVGIPMPSAGSSGSGGSSGKGQGGTGGAGRGRGGRPPESDADGQFQTQSHRARAILPGVIVGQEFVRGMPPGEHKPKVEYTEKVDAVASSTETAREKERVPREDRELIREYHNRIKGIDATTLPQE